MWRLVTCICVAGKATWNTQASGVRCKHDPSHPCPPLSTLVRLFLPVLFPLCIRTSRKNATSHLFAPIQLVQHTSGTTASPFAVRARGRCERWATRVLLLTPSLPTPSLLRAVLQLEVHSITVQRWLIRQATQGCGCTPYQRHSRHSRNRMPPQRTTAGQPHRRHLSCRKVVPFSTTRSLPV